MYKQIGKKLKKKIDNDISADVAQWECSNIKCYASAFSDISCIVTFHGKTL